MSQQRLYIVHGMGNDTTGLVGSITTPIAKVGGNIVDLRQDVLHGLFTIYLVVDLNECEIRIDAFKDIIKAIAEDTGLTLTVDNYHPVARNPEKKNMLIILVGSDKPGIVASIAQILGEYKANIEFANNVGREGIFLMELLTDISHCTLPFENLMSVIVTRMKEVGITALFQTEDVFNKKKRVILFDLLYSLIPKVTIKEILKQTGISAGEITNTFPEANSVAVVTKTAQMLEGLSEDVINTIAKNISVDPGTIELIQTLKIMGYKICIVSAGFSAFVNTVADRMGIVYRNGVDLQVNEDSRLVNGEIDKTQVEKLSIDNIKNQLAEKEQINLDDITVLSDKGLDITPGIRIELQQEKLLEMYNKRIISKENLIGLLGSFGIQRV